jgi:hypothetical protein
MESIGKKNQTCRIGIYAIDTSGGIKCRIAKEVNALIGVCH